MGNITIKKATIKKSGELSAEYTDQSEHGTETVKKECTSPVHKDMKLAFRSLNMHLALLCEQVREDKKSKAASIVFDDEEEDQVTDDMLYKLNSDNTAIAQGIKCNGFTLGGSGDHEGVCLIGSRKLSAERLLNLVSPFTKWQNDVYDYEYTNELSEIIETCKAEVHAYLFENKHAPNPQMALDFPEAE